MPQPTTAEVRLDEHKAASFGPAGRASCRFGFERVGCDRFSLPRNPQGRKIATNNFGIREMSAKIAPRPREIRGMLGKYVCQKTNRGLQHPLIWGILVHRLL